MSSPGFEMSMEHQVPVLMKKTQMNGEHGPQCGLTSLLPMSCRGRAAAFARDLHTRLRSLGNSNQEDDDGESSWLTREPAVATTPPHSAISTSPRELDTFYDFEIECESPSSPVDEFAAPFSDRSHLDNQDPPFYDMDSESEKEQAKVKLQHLEKPRTNGFTFSSAFYTDCSPVKLQPAPRENGYTEKQLFSPITFEGCARNNGHDEVDSVVKPLPLSVLAQDNLARPCQFNSSGDSDSEFESAKSDPSDMPDESFEVEKLKEIDLMEIENLSITETELPVEEVIVTETIENKLTETSELGETGLKTIISEVTDEKEVSPAPEINSTLLSSQQIDSKPDDNELEDDRPQRVRRCSSLKTGKTPPGTPGRKKIVRFADVLGLDLADVKTFMDEIPVIPKSAYDDLTGGDMQNSPPVRAPLRLGALTLVPLFQVPRDLTDKLERLNVCLESAKVGDGLHTNVCGSVRVRNLDFHKTVHIRYTMNRWKTYTDLQAVYVAGSCDGFSDRFQFVLYAPCISSGQRLEIALRFQCKGQQFWDNNNGANYCFDCLALGGTTHNSTIPTSGPLHPTMDWHPSFY